MVGLLGITLILGVNLHGLNCLGARHIAFSTSVYLICAKVQIVDNFFPNITFENDSHIHVMSSFKWYFLF